MAENSAIEWTDHTWSPWEGCQKVGPGCDNCYAEARNKRFAKGANWGPGASRRKTADWSKPYTWDKQAARDGVRRRTFPSLCDPFDNAADLEWRAEFFALIAGTPHLDHLLLTKRIGNAAAMIEAAVADVREVLPRVPEWPWPNVWLGATVVNQEEADRDIPKLLAVPARVRFLSIEPMLGSISLDAAFWSYEGPKHTARGLLHWVICGGESGPHARPMHPDWARRLRVQCVEAGVPFLFKQWGEWVPVDRNADGTVDIVDEIVGDVDLPDGKRIRTEWLSPDGGIVGHSFGRIGKKAAGRLLDGVEHNGFPASA